MPKNPENFENTKDYINLFNFNDDRFKNAKHVLTSPRSLKACSVLGIKVGTWILNYWPKDLLKVTYEEFLKKYDVVDKSFSSFKCYQQERILKLKECIETRETLKNTEDDIDYKTTSAKNWNKVRVPQEEKDYETNTRLCKGMDAFIKEQRQQRNNLRLTKEFEDWKNDFSLYKELQMGKSEILSRQFLKRKKDKTSQERFSRFLRQQLAMEEIQEQLKAQRDNTLSSIKEKEDRIESLKKEKKKQILESRKLLEKSRLSREASNKQNNFVSKDQQTLLETKVIYRNNISHNTACRCCISAC